MSALVTRICVPSMRNAEQASFAARAMLELLPSLGIGIMSVGMEPVNQLVVVLSTPEILSLHALAMSDTLGASMDGFSIWRCGLVSAPKSNVLQTAIKTSRTAAVPTDLSETMVSPTVLLDGPEVHGSRLAVLSLVLTEADDPATETVSVLQDSRERWLSTLRQLPSLCHKVLRT